MSKLLKNFGYIIYFVAFIFVGIVLSEFLFDGGLWLMDVLYPLLFLVSIIAFLVCFFVLFPLSVFQKTTGVAKIGFAVSSFVFGFTAWVSSCLLVKAIWGVSMLLVGLFFFVVGVIPLAMMATVFEGEFSSFIVLVVLSLLCLGSNYIYTYLDKKTQHKDL